MPIYEYQCDSCGHVFDALQKMSDDPLTLCPNCGAETLRKLVSAPNFRLKGAGWYETDFKDKNQRNLAGDANKGAEGQASGGTSDGKAADGKPADNKAGGAKSPSTAEKPAGSAPASSD